MAERLPRAARRKGRKHRVTASSTIQLSGAKPADQPCRLVYVTWEKDGGDQSKPPVWDAEELLLDVFPSFDRVRAICQAARAARGLRGRMRAVSLDRHLEKAEARVVPAKKLAKLLGLANAAGAQLIHKGDDAGKVLRDLVVELRPYSDLPPPIE